jgi:hypothetical protein
MADSQHAEDQDALRRGRTLDLFEPDIPNDKRIKPQEHVFLQALFCGKSRYDAIIEAYPRYKDAERAIAQRWAHDVLQRPHIRAALLQLQESRMRRAVWERWQSVEALKEIVDANRRTKDAVPAIRELNAMHGYNEASKFDVTLGLVGAVERRIIDVESDGDENATD